MRALDRSIKLAMLSKQDLPYLTSVKTHRGVGVPKFPIFESTSVLHIVYN